MYKCFPILFSLIITLLIGGCADKDKDKDKDFLGSKILVGIGDDSKISPDPAIVKSIFPNCNLTEEEENIWKSKECIVDNFSKKFEPEKDQNKFIIGTSQSRSMLHEIRILPTGMNYGSGTSIFEGLPGVKVEDLNCATWPEEFKNTKAYKITKKGQTLLTLVEEESFGSAGSTSATTLYVGNPPASCEAVLAKIDADQKLLVSKNLANIELKVEIIPGGIIEKTKGRIIKDNTFAAASGSCSGLIAVLMNRWPVIFEQKYAISYNETQKEWIRNAGNRVLTIVEKMKGQSNDQPVFDAIFKSLYTGTLSEDDAEWYVGFLSMTNSNNPDISTYDLSYMSACGEAGLIKKF